ncbi:hypothetical protein K0M31_014250 [Melipona bicolor]|uniref:Uncharacterized protein n=1 Tax=Melipona bicolor TaxID=60889 RepID=A0AA40G869_9HYME|nr:hypothetical protein K0M31_014250 [Melipona bicolor]
MNETQKKISSFLHFLGSNVHNNFSAKFSKKKNHRMNETEKKILSFLHFLGKSVGKFWSNAKDGYRENGKRKLQNEGEDRKENVGLERRKVERLEATRGLKVTRAKISSRRCSRRSFGYPWLAGYRYHAASPLVPARLSAEGRSVRVLSLFLGLDCWTQGCNRLRPCGVVAGAAVYSWKWSRYETKREGIALLAGERRGF